MIQKTILFIAIILLISCSGQRKSITIDKIVITDSTYIPIPSKEYNKPGNCQIIEIDNKEITINQGYKYGSSNQELYIIDNATKQIINKISLENILDYNEYDLSHYHFINKDSIFLFYSKFSVMDSAIIMVNYNNEIKKVYPINNPYISTNKHKFINDSLKISILFWPNKPIYTKDKIFFSFYLAYDADYGTEEFIKNKHPLIGYLDLKNDTIILNHDIWYPVSEEGAFYPFQSKIIEFCLSPNGNPIIGFANTTKLYKWDLENNKTKLLISNLRSQLIDTIYPLKTPSDIGTDNEQPYYGHINFDKEKEMYFRYIEFPKEKYGNFKRITVFADKDFNYLGEAYNSYYKIGETYHVNNTTSANWGMQHNINNWFYSEYEDSIKLVKTKYSFKKLNIDVIKNAMLSEVKRVKETKQKEICKAVGSDGIIKDINKKTIVKYFKNTFNISDSTFSVFTITDEGCDGCNDNLLLFFKANKQVISKLKTHLLFAGTNLDYFNKKITDYNLSNLNNLRIDSSVVYKEMHPFNNYNIRMTLVRDNKIVSDTVYMPNGLEKIMTRYIDFNNLKIEE